MGFTNRRKAHLVMRAACSVNGKRGAHRSNEGKELQPACKFRLMEEIIWQYEKLLWIMKL